MLKSSGAMSLATLLSRVLGLLREIVYARFGKSLMAAGNLVRNAGEDNLWFLRKRSGVYGWEPGTGAFGIVDPEDLQPLELCGAGV